MANTAFPSSHATCSRTAARGARWLVSASRWCRWLRDAWANGQILRDVAKIVGVDLPEQTMLSPTELVRRIELVLEAELRYFRQMPEDKMQGQVTGRPRSYANLAFHTFNIVDAWLEIVDGTALVDGAYNRNAAPGATKADGLRRGRASALPGVVARAGAGDGLRRDRRRLLRRPVQEHHFLERTTWHSGLAQPGTRSSPCSDRGRPPARPRGVERTCPCPKRSGTTRNRSGRPDRRRGSRDGFLQMAGLAPAICFWPSVFGHLRSGHLRSGHPRSGTGPVCVPVCAISSTV